MMGFATRIDPLCENATSTDNALDGFFGAFAAASVTGRNYSAMWVEQATVSSPPFSMVIQS